MPRLGRRSAGSAVEAITWRLSDELLAVEERCFAEIDLLFNEAAPRVAPTSLTAWRSGWRKPWAALVAETVTDASVPFAALVEQAVAMNLDAVGRQLLACEQTLAKKHAGTSGVGVSFAAGQVDGLLGQTFGLFRSQSTQIAANAMGEATRRAGTVETVDEVEAVMVGGGSPKGVWWQPRNGLKILSRSLSIELGNVLTTAAISGMNDACAAR